MSLIKQTISNIRMFPLLFQQTPSGYYQHLGTELVGGRPAPRGDEPLWLNLGYWKTARRYPDAAQALARLLGEAAQMSEGDHVLDAGYGFAEQDFQWLEEYGLGKVSGVNITPLHVEIANQRVRERGLEAKFDLRLGSATQLPFPAETFDKVVALESAFHFDTRDDFVREAFRVLKPGGRFAAADGTRDQGEGPPNWYTRLSLRTQCVPVENLCDTQEYCRRLEARGFVNIQRQSIREYVGPGALKYLRLRQQGVPMSEAVVELSDEEIATCYGFDEWKVDGFTDYLIFSAEKPY